MSFTTSGILRNESIATVRLFQEYHDWNRVRERIWGDNIFQLQKESSLKRIYSEVCARLKHLSLEEMEILTSKQPEDINAILWIAICRHYHFIGDFAKEVLHEKYLSMQKNLDRSDYAIFYEYKAQTHPELELLTDATRNRLRQMLFNFMRNLGLLNKNNEILPVYLSPVIENLLKNNNWREIVFFPTRKKG